MGICVRSYFFSSSLRIACLCVTACFYVMTHKNNNNKNNDIITIAGVSGAIANMQTALLTYSSRSSLVFLLVAMNVRLYASLKTREEEKKEARKEENKREKQKKETNSK